MKNLLRVFCLSQDCLLNSLQAEYEAYYIINVLQFPFSGDTTTGYDTRKLLKKIGYINTKVHLHIDRVILANREIYSRYVKTVILKPFIEHLPDDKIRNRYWNYFWMTLKREVLIVRNLKPRGP